jgi:hypothetical protein
MVTTTEGNRVRSKITGQVYDVKKLVKNMVVLDSVDGSSQIMTELKNIELFYEREPTNDGDQG